MGTTVIKGHMENPFGFWVPDIERYMDIGIHWATQETSDSLGQKIQLAMATTGSAVSVTIIEIGHPSVSIKTTETTSTAPSTTTAYCPGNPVCGGISGECVEAVNDTSRSWHCECSETYDGEACEIRRCPRCLNNGTCVSGTQSPNSEWGCECPEGYQGTLAVLSHIFHTILVLLNNLM